MSIPRRFLCWSIALPLAATPCGAAPPTSPATRTQSFDADPGWDGYRNRLEPPRPHVVRQQFGYRTTHKAGGAAPGEVGGRVQRSITPAWYAMPVEPRTLHDRITFSGRF